MDIRIPFWLIALVVLVGGAGFGVVGLAVLRKLGMKEPDRAGQMKSGDRCEMCEQTTVQRMEDGSISCFGCGHVTAASPS